MSSGRDEVEQCMNSVVPETRISLDSGLLCKNVIVLTLEVTDDLLEARGAKELSQAAFQPRAKNGREYIRRLVVDIVSKSWSVDNRQSDTDAVFLQFCKEKKLETWMKSTEHERGDDVPTCTGLILIPSSSCDDSALSEILCARTSDPQRVFTNVVRPVPEAPFGHGEKSCHCRCTVRKGRCTPTTMTVNWTPFLTLFPLRLAYDMA